MIIDFVEREREGPNLGGGGGGPGVSVSVSASVSVSVCVCVCVCFFCAGMHKLGRGLPDPYPKPLNTNLQGLGFRAKFGVGPGRFQGLRF